MPSKGARSFREPNFNKKEIKAIISQGDERGWTISKIAVALNRKGLTTESGRSFTQPDVSKLRLAMGFKRRQAPYSKGLKTKNTRGTKPVIAAPQARQIQDTLSTSHVTIARKMLSIPDVFTDAEVDFVLGLES